MKKLLFAIAINFLIPIGLSAQTEEKKGDALTAGYDTTAYHPFYISTSDKKFLLNLGLYTQFRYNINMRENTPDTVITSSRGFNLARTRIFLEGNYSSKFYYHFRMNINSANTLELMAAYLQWNMNDNMNIRVGKQFVALGLEDWMYPCDLAGMEFSATDFTYAIWSSFAAQFHHKVSDKFRYWAAVGNGFYGARRNFSSNGDPSNITLSGRVEFNPFGNWGLWGNMTGRKGSEFGVLLGVGGGHSMYSNNISQIEFGESRNASQLNVDFSVSHKLFHFFSQYVYTTRTLEGDTENNRYGSAFFSTFGYWLSPKVFPFLKADFVGKGNLIGVTEDYFTPGAGLSFYPFNWTNRYRFTLEYFYLNSTLNNTYVVPDGQLGLVESSYGGQHSLRFQLQFGF